MGVQSEGLRVYIRGVQKIRKKENKTVMAAFSILAILTAYAAAGPVPTTDYNNQEPQVSTKPFRHTAPSVTCRTEYVVLWSTKYDEREEQVCQTLVQNLCRPTTRQECHIKQTEVCKEIKRNVCVQKFKTEYQPYTETECKTEYKQDCQYAWKGTGNDKVWSPIEGTCQNVPYDSCKEVSKTQARQVAYQECHDVPEKKCSLVPEQVCVNVPDEVCQQVPKQQCHSEHKKFPIRISRQEAKKVCNVPGQPKTPSPLAPSIPVAVVPTFTAPAPVPSSPAFNQQPTFENSQPLDRQRGVAFEDEDDHASVDVPTTPLEEMDDKKPSTQLQGGLSTLDEILAARRANAKPQPTLSEKLVFSS